MSFYAEVFVESRLTAQLWFDDFFFGWFSFFVVRPNKRMHLDILYQLLHPRAPAKARPREAFRSRPSEPFRHNKADAHCPLVSRQSGGIKSLTPVSRDKPSGKAFLRRRCSQPQLIWDRRVEQILCIPLRGLCQQRAAAAHRTTLQLHRQAATLDQATHAIAQR